MATTTFTKEDLCCDARLTSLNGGSGVSRKLTFSVKENDQASGKSKTSLYIHDPDTLSNNRFTRPQNFGDAPVSNATVFEGDPRSPISEIMLFLRGGQVYCQPLHGGEALQVTSTSVDISSFRIFQTPALQPLLVVSMSVYPNMTPEETKAYDDDVSENTKSNAMVFDKLMVRHWDEWDIYKKRNHIFLLPLDITAESLLSSDPSKALDLMKGIHSDCPMKPFGGVSDYCISPDGTKLAFVCRKYWTILKTEPTDISWTTESYAHMVDITTTLSEQAPSVTLLDMGDYQGSCALGTFSPDSERLALLKMKTDVYESDKTEIMICSTSTGSVDSITRHIDLSFSSPTWSMDGQCIYALAQLRGIQRLIKLTLKDTQNASVSMLDGDASKGAFVLVNDVPSAAPSQTDYLYYTESTITSPSEIKVAILVSSDNTLFTDITELAKNPTLSSEGQHALVDSASFSHRYVRDIFSPCPKYTNGDLNMPSVEVHYFKGAENDIVHAFYLPPVTEKEMVPKSIPLVLLVHGGPQGAFLNSWSYRWNPSYYASQGYGVVTVNFHGSTGFGQKFCNSIRGDWNGKPYEDCMAAVDYILGKYDYLNPDKVAALGASYGGYMVNTINGKTDRFKCLVNHDGIFNLKSLYFSTEETWFPEYEFGIPWESPENYIKFSPDSYVQNWKTPTLVIHGSKDYRIADVDGISTFTALQRLGVPSKLLIFPTENHWVLNFNNSLVWHENVTEWLERWLKIEGQIITT